MRRIRIYASRRAWVLYLRGSSAEALSRYQRVVAYECRRNGTESYTPFWAA
jgi:hypothetical protein